MNSPQQPTAGGAISLDTLIALNDEIAWLVRAGIPLELGLREFGEDQRSALSRISNELAARMSVGESLVDAIAAGGDQFPAVYGRVVEAGLRAGRLPAAVEAISRFATELVDLRRRIGVAMIYPLIVVLLAYGLFVVFIAETGRRYLEAYESMQIPVHGALRLLGWTADWVSVWGWIPPLLLVGVVLWWILAPDISIFRLEGPRWPLTWIPGLKSITTNYWYANFADLSALLIDHGTPLPEAIELAADATGDWKIQHAAHVVAEAQLQGEPPGEAAKSSVGLPSFLNWLVSHGENRGDLPKSLRLAAAMYRDRARVRIEWLRFVFPVLASIVVGGGAVMLYALALFLPMVSMLNDLSFP